MDTQKKKRINGVLHLSDPPYDFEAPYLKFRKKESYVLSDAEVSELPNTFLYNLHRKEWELRAKSIQRLYNYLKKQEMKKIVLDLGCGNGWVSSKIAQIEGIEVWGLDINLFELEQAARVFPQENLKFCYGNVYENIFEEASFDYIIISDAISYFSNLQQLINRSRSLLKGGGEIHILDSPIYTENQLEDAQKQKEAYFEKLSCLEMMEYYHFHQKSDLAPYDYEFLYTYGFFKRLLRKKDSIYPWVKIIN